MTDTYVLLRRDWTADNVLALASEGYQPVAADPELIVFGKTPLLVLRSGVHDALVAAAATKQEPEQR